MDENEQMLEQTKDTKINLLKRTIEERDQEIEVLKKDKDALQYFIEIHFESMRRILHRDQEAIQMVKSGKLAKPVLIAHHDIDGDAA